MQLETFHEHYCLLYARDSKLNNDLQNYLDNTNILQKFHARMAS